jgi:hypothetical protein
MRQMNMYDGEYRLCAIDNHHGFEFEHEDSVYSTVYSAKYDEEYASREIHKAIVQSDVVIHMAEDTVPLMTMPEDAMRNNVSFTTEVLSIAAQHGVRTLIICWKEFSYETPVTPWEASIIWRAELGSMFQRGNAVINQVFLPRIISPLHFTMTYGNLVKRFYKAATEGTPADVYSGEIDDHIEWCWVTQAVKEITRIMKRRTRAPKHIQGHMASAKSIAEYVAAKTNVEYIDVRSPKDKLIRRAVYDSDTLENQTIKSAINRCIEVWDGQK